MASNGQLAKKKQHLLVLGSELPWQQIKNMDIYFFRFPEDATRVSLDKKGKVCLLLRIEWLELLTNVDIVYCNENRLKKCAINTRRLDLMRKDAAWGYLYRNIRLCSEHFENEMFTNNSKKALTTDAAPTLFQIPNPLLQIGQKCLI